jgi:hypothetical protein
MQRIYSSPNSLMVDHFKAVLEAEGIACVIKGRLLSSAAGELPPTETWTQLWVVDDGLAQEATAIIERTSGTDASPAWQCRSCGESIGGQFDSCWKCGTERDGRKGRDFNSTDESPVGTPPPLLRQPGIVRGGRWLVLFLLALFAVLLLQTLLYW